MMVGVEGFPVECPGFAVSFSSDGGGRIFFSLLELSLTSYSSLPSLYFNGNSPLKEIHFQLWD
jgi:hypothetical protein